MRTSHRLFPRLSSLLIAAIVCVAAAGPGRAEIIGLWHLDGTTTVAGQSLTPNAVPGGVPGVVNGNPQIVNDLTRGSVMEFDGNNHVDGGFVPQLTPTGRDFTWTFWSSQSTTQGVNDDVILGNRFGGTGGGWIKFTPNKFEYRPVGDIDYDNIPSDQTWIHNAVVKSGGTLTYYRNGVPSGPTLTDTGGMNVVPFFMGGDPGGERWRGRLDDVALFGSALTQAQVQQAMAGNFAGLMPKAAEGIRRDGFGGSGVDPGMWQILDKGLEYTGPSGYDAPSTAGGVLTLGGMTNHSYWGGSTLRSVEAFSPDHRTAVSVDRLSLSGTGTARRSSLWMWADDGHYLHFSQNFGENGWQYNWNDVGGLGGVPTGGGVDIGLPGELDNDLGLFEMKLVFTPGDVPGEATIGMYLDNVLVASRDFTNWTGDYQVMLTGQARQSGDTVAAVFDNAVIETIPEPTTLAALALGVPALAWYRRKRRAGR